MDHALYLADDAWQSKVRLRLLSEVTKRFVMRAKMQIRRPRASISANAAFAASAGTASPGDSASRKRASHPRLQHIKRGFALVLLLHIPLSTSAALSATGCDETSIVSASHLRYARLSHNSMDYTSRDDNCRVFIKQFVEAIEARQAAATCQDSVARHHNLEILDGEIQTLNERIAEQSCSP